MSRIQPPQNSFLSCDPKRGVEKKLADLNAISDLAEAKGFR